jgi:hypothetical protein
MNKRFLILIGVAAGFTASSSIAADRDASLYVGVKSCKMCHKKAEEGEQFAKWSESKHAKAFEMLASPEAKEAGKKVGVDDPQKSGKCLKCHSTAYNWTEAVASQEIPVEEGVSCESCHGPGKNYKKKEIMKDVKQAVANGLVEKPKEFCKNCHNDQSPTWKGSFDVEKAYEKIKHPKPKT